MTSVHTFFQRSVGRMFLVAALAAGVAGGALSASNPGWFHGSTADAGMPGIGIPDDRPVDKPIKVGTVEPTDPIPSPAVTDAQ